MKRYLIYSDAKSDKFWKIETDGKSYTVTYGKIGTAGAKQTKTFINEGVCVKEADKLIKAKLKKGYEEHSESDIIQQKTHDDYFNEWKKIVASKNKSKALVKHFSFLLDTPGFEPILEAVVNEVIDVTCSHEKLIVIFPGNETLEAFPPSPKIPKNYPSSFQKILEKHEQIIFTNSRLHLGLHGNLSEEDGWVEVLEDEESELLALAKPSDLISPLWDYSDCWIYHPKEKNQFNEPVIYFLSHEGGDITDPQSHNAGGLFLKRCVETLDLEVSIPDIIDSAIDPETWWDSLDSMWKEYFHNEHKIENVSQAKKGLALKRIYINEKYKMTNLKPLQAMSYLTEISCNGPELTDISPLSSMRKLTNLRISGKKIIDFSPLKHLKKLKYLNLSDSNIVDLSPLADLEILESLELSNTYVENIDPVVRLKKLEKLDLENTKVNNCDILKEMTKLTYLNLSKTQITSFEFLSELKNIGTFKAFKTGMTSLKALYNCKKIYILSCWGTPVTFEEILRFSKAMNHGDKLLGLDIYSGFNDSLRTKVEAVEKIDFNIDGIEDTLIIWINNTFISLLKKIHPSQKPADEITADERKNYESLCCRLLKAASNLPIQNGSQKLLEELAGNMLAAIVPGTIDKEITEVILNRFIPQPVNNSRLAFNMACYYAKNNDKTKLMEYTALALKKGYERVRFQLDEDFALFRNDNDFAELIASPLLPDPEKDPWLWWQNISEDLKDMLQDDLEEETEQGVRNLLHRDDFELWYDRPKSLDNLRDLKGLKKLVLRECMAKSLEALETLTGLEELECEKDQYLDGVEYSNIEHLSGLINLKKLILRGHKINDVSPLTNMVNLEALDLAGNSIESAAPLQNLVRLKDLRISFKAGIATDLRFLNKMKNLSILSISVKGNGKLKLDSLDDFHSLTALEYLWLNDIETVNGEFFSLQPFAELTNLKMLSLDNVKFQTLSPLFCLKSLKEITLNEVTDQYKKEIKANMPWCKLG